MANPRPTPRAIKLMADYDCWPLWRVGEQVGNIDPATLPLPADLQLALEHWAQAFDNTLNRDDPASSGFESDEEWHSFQKESALLAQRLSDALGPDVTVINWHASQFGDAGTKD